MKARDTNPSSRNHSSRADERGAVAILAALMLVALIALILLAVQMGDVGMVRGMLQGSADEAALAGASQIDGTATGLTNARTEAGQMVAGGRNFPQAVNNGQDLNIGGTAFDTGVWGFDPPGFTPSNDPDEVNAVRVIGRKIASQNQAVPMFLGGFLGSADTVPVARVGIAAIGSPDTLPCRPEIPLAACDPNIASHCGQELTFITSPSTSDNACWTTFTNSPASAQTIGGMIDNCLNIPADLDLGDPMALMNGNATGQTFNNLQSRLKTFQESTGNTVDNSGRAVCTTPNVKLPDPNNPTCRDVDDRACGATTAGGAVDINNDGVVNNLDCGMAAAIPLVPGSACTSNCNQSAPLVGYALVVVTQVTKQGTPKVVKAIPVCGVQFPGTTTGPGKCAPDTPLSCAKIPVLVNSAL